MLNREASKRTALSRLCADFQIPRERVLAIGDSRQRRADVALGRHRRRDGQRGAAVKEAVVVRNREQRPPTASRSRSSASSCARRPAAGMTVRVVAFGRVRELLGWSERALDVDRTPARQRRMGRARRRRSRRLRTLAPTTRVARNGVIARGDGRCATATNSRCCRRSAAADDDRISRASRSSLGAADRGGPQPTRTGRSSGFSGVVRETADDGRAGRRPRPMKRTCDGPARDASDRGRGRANASTARASRSCIASERSGVGEPSVAIARGAAPSRRRVRRLRVRDRRTEAARTDLEEGALPRRRLRSWRENACEPHA